VARVSSKMENKQITTADYARKITNEILELRNRADILVWELTKRLKEVRDKQLWKIEGEESFFSYLARPEFAFDRTTTLRWIQIYETFIDKYSLAPSELNKIGWTKLAKVVPHVDDDNYKYMLELAETNSRSDIDRELVKQHYLTPKEPEEQAFIECVYCHRMTPAKKRKDESYPQEDYNRVIEKYKEVKGIDPKGDEYKPIQQAIKTMFMNGRTPDQIISVMEHERDAEYSWTIKTIATKIAEILPQVEPQEEMTDFEKRWKNK